MKWIELSVRAHPEAVDAIASVFHEHGTGGVAIYQPVDSHIEGEAPPTFTGFPVVTAYLPANDSEPEKEERIERALWHLRAFDLSPLGEMTRREVEDEDWANAWKEHFHPQRIGNFVIKPSWREWREEPSDVVVELDPGMAFGTGLHPTTRLMLEALQTRVRPGTAILDLGTGSGILSIAAARLGGRVTAIDTSDVAVQVARQNVAANRLASKIRVLEGTIDTVRGKRYDLILANISASVLIDLAPPLADALRLRGVLLASGIVGERLDGVRTAFMAAGLQIEEELSDDDWWLVAAGTQG